MHNDVAPLLLRPRPYPDESLASWLVRLSIANGYCGPRAADYSPRGRIAHMAGGPTKADWSTGALAAPKSPRAFGQLALLTRTPLAVLHGATAHRFALLFTPPERDVDMMRIPGSRDRPLLRHRPQAYLVNPHESARYCPHCLRDAAYHRLLWMVTSVAVCLRHNCLLLMHCPDCRATTLVQGVVTGHCLACGADLTAASPPTLPPDAPSRFAQAVLRSWLLEEPLPEQAVALARSLPDAPSRVLFRVVDGLRLSAQAGDPWPYPLPKPPPIARAGGALAPVAALHLYAAAFRPLLDWPGNWRDFLDATADRAESTNTDAGRGGASLGHLYGTPIQRAWRGPAFSWLQRKVDQHLLARYGQDNGFHNVARGRGEDFRAQREYLDLSAAAVLLGCPRTLLDRLLTTGHLARHESQDRRNGERLTLVTREDVLVFREEFRRWIRRPVAATFLGVTEELFDELVAPELIPAAIRSEEGGETACWYFDRAALDAWQTQLTAGAIAIPVPSTGASGRQAGSDGGPWLPLWRAVRVMNPLGWDAALFVEQCAAGTIQAYRREADAAPSLGTILFSGDALRNLVAAERRARGWLSSTEATSHLGCATDTFATLVAAGTLIPIATIGKTRYFTHEALDRYMRASATTRAERATARVTAWGLTSGAAAELLGTTLNSVMIAATAGYLPTLPQAEGDRARWRFDPAALRAWREAHLTLAEAAAALDLSPEDLRLLARQGHITSPFGASYRPWFRRSEVEHARDELAAQRALPTGDAGT